MLDAKAKKWLHPGLGGGPVRAPRSSPTRAAVLASYRSTFDQAGWTLGLSHAGPLRGLQERAMEFLSSAATTTTDGWDSDLEAAVVAVAQRSAEDAVQVWVREAGLAFALRALWRKSLLLTGFEYLTPTCRHWLEELDRNFWGGPDDAWWALRKLAALATPEQRAAAVAEGERLIDDGTPTLNALAALVLPEPRWVERALRERNVYWLWSVVLTHEQAKMVLGGVKDNDAGRFLLSWHAADLADRLGHEAAPLLSELLAWLERDLSAWKRGHHDLELAVARVKHVLTCVI